MARRKRTHLAGHAFTGQVPVREISQAAYAYIAQLKQERTPRDPARAKQIDAELAELTGFVIPTCECGWRGSAEGWTLEWETYEVGTQHNEHLFLAKISRAQGETGAGLAAIVLALAAEDWEGDPAVSDWLTRRADHVAEVGYFDGKTWPEADSR